MVSPACFHVFIIGLLDLFLTCQGAVLLLTHLLSQVQVQGVTACSLDQKYSGIAAAARIDCREREGKNTGSVLKDSSPFRYSIYIFLVRYR